MPTSHHIILVGLDDQSRSVVESCLPNDRFKITQVDPVVFQFSSEASGRFTVVGAEDSAESLASDDRA